jgi:hypothetical protein
VTITVETKNFGLAYTEILSFAANVANKTALEQALLRSCFVTLIIINLNY